MMDETWIRQYIGSIPEPDPVLVLWCHYHVATEDYDRRMPGRWSKHDPESWEVDPGHGYRGLSIGFARRTMEQLGLKAAPREAKTAAGKMGYRAQKAMTERYSLEWCRERLFRDPRASAEDRERLE